MFRPFLLWSLILQKSRERHDLLDKHPENALTPSQTNLIKVIQEKERNPQVSVSNTVTNNSNVQNPTNSSQEVLSDSSNKDRSNVPNVSSQQVIVDSNNKNRRVSFVPLVASQKRPPVTPTRDPLPVYYPSPYAYPNNTALHAPTSPSIQYSAYHGYGVPLYINGPVPVSNQANANRFVKRSRNVSED